MGIFKEVYMNPFLQKSRQLIQTVLRNILASEKYSPMFDITLITVGRISPMWISIGLLNKSTKKFQDKQ